MTAKIERMLPLYEAKMIHQFDHRWATYELDGATRYVTNEEKQDAAFVALPRYWVSEDDVLLRLGQDRQHGWLLVWRDICRSTDERTMIASHLPTAAVGHTLPLAIEPGRAALLMTIWSSFAFDFVARQKVGGIHMTYGYLMQLAAPTPDFEVGWADDIQGWLSVRSAFLQSAESWATTRREEIRAEVDGAMFHVFGVSRDDVDYIMETFPIVRRKDEASHGSYRTKELILAVYDAIQTAIDTGVPYSSPFDEFLEASGRPDHE